MNVLCPVCHKNELTPVARYPRMLCSVCHEGEKKDEAGNPVEFQNIDLFGGFQSLHNGKIKKEHICYIKNVRCYATEARFGGIVIQTMEPEGMGGMGGPGSHECQR